MNCPNCQQQVIAGSNFCDSCGASLLVSAGQPAAPAVLPATLVQPSRGTHALPVCPQCQTPGRGPYCDRCGAPVGPGAAYPPSVGQPLPVAVPPRFILQPADILFPFPAGKPEVSIGREDPDQHLIPDINFESYGGANAGVSRQHAIIRFDGRQWQLEHRSRINKTLVYDLCVQLGHTCPLKNGDIVLIGRLTLLFRI